MDVRVYFEKVRKIESEILEDFVIVSSFDTEDGGKQGVLTEVRRRPAAQLIVEGKARLATWDEHQAYYTRVTEARRIAEEMAAAGRLQVTLVSGDDLRALKASSRTQK